MDLKAKLTFTISESEVQQILKDRAIEKAEDEFEILVDKGSVKIEYVGSSYTVTIESNNSYEQ